MTGDADGTMEPMEPMEPVEAGRVDEVLDGAMPVTEDERDLLRLAAALRAGQPEAPDRLRARIAALAETPAGAGSRRARLLGIRGERRLRAAWAAAAVVAVVGIGAAVLNGTGSEGGRVPDTDGSAAAPEAASPSAAAPAPAPDAAAPARAPSAPAPAESASPAPPETAAPAPAVTAMPAPTPGSGVPAPSPGGTDITVAPAGAPAAVRRAVGAIRGAGGAVVAVTPRRRGDRVVIGIAGTVPAGRVAEPRAEDAARAGRDAAVRRLGAAARAGDVAAIARAGARVVAADASVASRLRAAGGGDPAGTARFVVTVTR